MSATFTERVREFWQWFPGIADEVKAGMKSNDPQAATERFASEVREKIGGLSWVFGPGRSEDSMSFTVTGEARKARQLLSQYWLSQATDIPGWDFYSSRQPSSIEKLASVAIQVGETEIDAETLKVSPQVMVDDQRVDLRIWHQVFEHLPEDARWQISFLLLDEALGEFGTQSKLGNIEFAPDPKAISLVELPALIDQVWSENGWRDLLPLESYVGYESPDPTKEFPRGDTIAGHTVVPDVVLEFLNNGGSLDEDPVEGTGAQFVYVQIDNSVMGDDPLEFRDQVEEKILSRLDGHGYCVGGATGIHYSYIDLLIFDGDRSEQAIVTALQAANLQDGYQIIPFFRE